MFTTKELTTMTTVLTCNPTQPIAEATLSAIKTRQQVVWGSGDFAVIGTTLQIVGERICESLDVRSTERVLDVAAGNGNATLAAARRFADVTSTDFVMALLEQGRNRADTEGLRISFQQADAEALPFEDASFDVAMSTFGVMFTPDQPRAARELARVVKPRTGRIGLASWTPEGFIGELFRTVGRFVPPAAGLRSPSEWGTPARLRELFPSARRISNQTQTFAFRYLSAMHWIEVFRAFYGPVHVAFATLDIDGRRDLEAALLALLAKYDVGGGRGLVVPAEYLETVIEL